MTSNHTTGLAVTIRCVPAGRRPANRRAGGGVADLGPVRYETWLRGMRGGVLPPEMEGLCCNVLPGQSLGSGVLADYAIELADGQRRFRQDYTVYSLEQTARRNQAVVSAGNPDGQRSCPLLPDHCGGRSSRGRRCGSRRPRRGHRRPSGGRAARVKRRCEPLVLEPASLAAFLKASRLLREGTAPLSPTDEDRPNHLPIFIDDEVWEESRALARRGGDLESAAVWTGRLMRDVETPEIFLLIEAVIEAQHAQETEYSILFSGETWQSVRELLEQRRRRLNRPHERILGSVHGHNFLPHANEEGQRICASCDRLATCAESTAVASSLDEEWHRTIFAATPWAALGVWGWTAHREEVWQVYSLTGGALLPRTIRVVAASAIAGLTSSIKKGAEQT